MPSMAHQPAVVARTEDVLLACVAYSRPELVTFDRITRLHSAGSLDVAAPASSGATLNSLPPEVLLRVRGHLQASLRKSVAADTSAALTAYESALVEGLCADCFAWHSDVYGDDIWEWVENGYTGSCRCHSADSLNDEARPATSKAKQQVDALYDGLEIECRARWLRAHVSRKYCDGRGAWRYARNVLAELGCAARIEGGANAQNCCARCPSSAPASEAQAKRGQRNYVPGNFGALVSIEPAEGSEEDVNVVHRRLRSELGLPLSTEEASITAKSSKFCQPVHPFRS